MLGLDLFHRFRLLGRVLNLDNVIITVIVISCSCLSLLAVVGVVSMVNCFPLSVRLYRNLVNRTGGVLQNVLYVIVDTKALVGEGLVADGASPSWRLFLELQEVRAIEALIVRADIGPARDVDAHG